MNRDYLQSLEWTTTAETPQMEQLAGRIRAAWQEAHGTRPGRAFSLTGSCAVAFIIEDALSPAERLIGGQGAHQSELLARYVRALFQEICRSHTVDVEQVSGVGVRETAVFVQPDSGWLVGIFRLAQPV